MLYEAKIMFEASEPDGAARLEEYLRKRLSPGSADWGKPFASPERDLGIRLNSECVEVDVLGTTAAIGAMDVLMNSSFENAPEAQEWIDKHRGVLEDQGREAFVEVLRDMLRREGLFVDREAEFAEAEAAEDDDE